MVLGDPDLLFLILKELDAGSLHRFYQASGQVRAIIMQHKVLRYRLELEISGMKNEPASDVHPCDRLEQLLNLKRSLPTLCWSQERTLQVVMPPGEVTVTGVSGGFFYHTKQAITAGYVLELHKLPCPRVRPLHTDPVPLTFRESYAIRSVTVDVAQNLLVMGSVHQLNDWITVRLHFRTLVGQAKSGDVAFPLEWGNELEHKVSIDHVQICGRLVGVSIGQETGNERIIGKFALIDWRTRKKHMWATEVHSFQFLNETEILVVLPPEEDDIRMPCRSSRHVRPRRLAVHKLRTLKLEDIKHVQTRVYQLPESWNDADRVDIKPNMSPLPDTHIPAGTMFYPDPACRIVVLTATFDGPFKKISPVKFMVLPEAVLKAAPVDSQCIPWNQWGQHCLVKDIPHVGLPSLHVIGPRIFYLEGNTVFKSSVQPSRRRVHVLDFNPNALECARPNTRCAAPWAWQKPWKMVTMPVHDRVLPHIQTQTTDWDEISEFFATEDNLILLVKYRDAPEASVTVLTFD